MARLFDRICNLAVYVAAMVLLAVIAIGLGLYAARVLS